MYSISSRCVLCVVLAGICTASGAQALDDGQFNRTVVPGGGAGVAGAGFSEPLLQPYEPITAGYTKNSNDVPFLDVALSLKYRILPTDWTGERNRAFLAMSTRFGFYWGTRDGSPVVGKSYNPKLIWRRVLGGEAMGSDQVGAASGRQGIEREYEKFLDLAYAHESNGQLIHTQAEFAAAQRAAQQPQYVEDNIHRGWDYFEVLWKNSYALGGPGKLASFLDLKGFLPVGLLQRAEDEYHAWEADPQGKQRDTVDGVSAAVRYQAYDVGSVIDETRAFSRPDVLLRYTTGYHSAFKYSTVRAEFGFQAFSLPLALWLQSGYMSDLAMYYRKVNSLGVELRIRAF